MNTPGPPRRRTTALATAGLLAASFPLTAHDFWLVPDAFLVAAGETVQVRGQTSSAFPSSEAAVGPDRIASARVIDDAGEAPLGELSRAGNSLLIRHRPVRPGQKIVAVTLHPVSVRESAEGFRRAGDTLPVRLLFHGRALAGARVHAGVVARPPGAELDALAGTERHIQAVTDADGRFDVALDAPGLWNVRALHVLPAEPGSGADWDSHWATLVFGIGDGVGPAASARQDSAAVVAAVDRYHAGLAAGDSAVVAALLAPDAIILESGGVETRDEYLGGHLRGDIAFAAAVPRERGPVRVTLAGDVAWAVSTSTARGQYRGRAVNAATAELMVLRRDGGSWRIAAIHWSSRTLR